MSSNPTPARRLQGRVVLITGAARGIGKAVVEVCVAEGAQVICTDIDTHLGSSTADELGVRFMPLDVRQPDDWQAAARRIEQDHGHLHGLVNNAGITGLEDGAPHDPENSSLADWRAVLATNLDGVFLGCQTALRLMRHLPEGHTGAIVNVSSRSGIVGIPAAAAYAASKAAVRNHTKTVALYSAEQRLPVRCNSLHPAAILTPMWEPMLGQGEARAANMAALVADTPLRRFGTPAEVARAAVFLLSDDSSYMTGAELHLDGGILAGSAAVPNDAAQQAG